MLEETTEDVVVIKEVFTVFGATRLEGSLQLLEECVKLTQNLCTRDGWLNSSDSKDDLQPLLDVVLHVQRSEYRSDRVFVDSLV